MPREVGAAPPARTDNLHDLLDGLALVEQAAALEYAAEGLLGVEVDPVRTARCTRHHAAMITVVSKEKYWPAHVSGVI